MFEITIKGETLGELASNLLAIAGQYQTTPAGGDAAPARKPRAAKPKAEEPVDDEDGSGEDSLLAPAEPMPDTAKAVVDAGTGKPVEKTEAPVKMTMEDVKVAAAKLVAKDTAAFAGILKKYDAPNLSGVPKDKLGDFAADVMEALG